ncbi:MAG: carboxypeptidase regulatory-like domain-containing protein [Acidobacteria bacterium]|nr:carboxypeptidase regulatory-like domain-containing protein [Acidobacteriota bacterium]
MKFTTLSFLSILLAALGIPAFCQTSTGSIAGSVRDAQDAAIANANVVLREMDKQTTFSLKSDAEGRFVFTNLLPGRYSITVESTGFKKLERTDINLLANDKITIGVVSLDVGTLSESVQVSAQVTQLKTESAERSEAMTATEMQNIAVNSRSYLQLTGLLPGVVSTANLTTGGHAGLANISANGARFDQNNLTLNGLGNVDTGNNGDQLATISLDAVQEFKVLSGTYQAEYGRSSGAQISVVTKSGTKDFHGSVFEYHRHEGLNANNWKNNRDGIQRNLFRFNDFGYTIGGPIYIPGRFNKEKDKLFFFWSQEYQKQLKPQGNRNMTVPTALERTGDFSKSVDKNGAAIPAIKDPLTGQPFPGGIIPGSRLYAPGVAMLKFFPEPTVQGQLGFNFRSQIPDSYPRREDLIRGDYNLNDKWRFFSHYLNNADSVTSNYGSFVLGSGFPKVPITDQRPGKSLAVNATTMINPTLTNEATWGFGKNIIHIDPVNDGLTRAKTGINVPMLYPSAVQKDFIPRFGYAGSRIGNEQRFGTNNAPFFNYNTTIDWIDNVSKIWKSHVFKAGVYVQRSRKDQTSFANSNGDIGFGDDASNPVDTGFGFANMAAGTYTTFNQASGYFTGMYRYTNIEWYVQDNWKVNRRLTLDFGIRFQIFQPQYDAALQTSTWLPERYDPKNPMRLYYPVIVNGAKVAQDRATGQVAPATAIGKIVSGTGSVTNGIAQAGKTVEKGLIQSRGVHYAPRFGLAYDLTGKQNLIVRGGAGIFYDRFQGNEVFDMLTNPPTTTSPTMYNGYLKDTDAKTALLAPLGLNAFDWNGPVPTVYNWNFGFQARLPYSLILDSAYVGSEALHQLQRVNLNAIPYGATFQAQNQDPTKSSSTLGSAAYDRDFLRAYPGFGDIALHAFGGTANYNSLQTTLSKRFSKGLTFNANHTWARSLGTSDDRGNYNRIDGNTRMANYALTALHRQHTFNFYYTYDLPSLVEKSSFWNYVVNGWQLSGATSFATGSPFTPGISINGIGNANVTGSYTEGYRLKLIGKPNTGSDNPYNRINPAAFTIPPVGTNGIDAPRNYLINPGVSNWNFTIQKEFAFVERYRIQLRADAFNVFNHTQFSGINGTLNFANLTNTNPTNLYLKADGTLNNINGFGTVSGARDPRVMQLTVRFQF